MRLSRCLDVFVWGGKLGSYYVGVILKVIELDEIIWGVSLYREE